MSTIGWPRAARICANTSVAAAPFAGDAAFGAPPLGGDALVALFGAVGVAPEKALAVSLLWGLLPLLVSLPAGFLWWAGGTQASSPVNVGKVGK